MIKRLFIWLAILGGIVALIFFAIQFGEDTNRGESGITPVTASDWQKGNPEALVTLVEYSDFQCPACRVFYPILNQLEAELGDQVRFVYRHFPLSQIHFNAELAARAAEAAGVQGDFWGMHNKIFEGQPFWSRSQDPRDTFIRYAEELGLDIDKFREDIDSREMANKVGDQYRMGLRDGVNSTPTFYLNGELIRNPRSVDEFRNILLEAIGEIQG